MHIFEVKKHIQLEEMNLVPGMFVTLDHVFGTFLEKAGKIKWFGGFPKEPVYDLESP